MLLTSFFDTHWHTFIKSLYVFNIETHWHSTVSFQTILLNFNYQSTRCGVTLIMRKLGWFYRSQVEISRWFLISLLKCKINCCHIPQFLKGAISMEDHLPYRKEVGGSIPPFPIINLWLRKWLKFTYTRLLVANSQYLIATKC